MLKQVFQKIVDKFDLIRKPLKVNTANGVTLGRIGTAPLDLNTEEQNFTHNSIVCPKLKKI